MADHNVAREAYLRCFREYGYDVTFRPNYYWPMLPGKFCKTLMRLLIPRKQFSEDDLNQIDERILLSRENYDTTAALAWNGFWNEHYQKNRNTPE